MKTITYTGPDDVSQAIVNTDGNGSIALPKGKPCELSDQVAADFLAAGTEFKETKNKEK